MFEKFKLPKSMAEKFANELASLYVDMISDTDKKLAEKNTTLEITSERGVVSIRIDGKTAPVEEAFYLSLLSLIGSFIKINSALLDADACEATDEIVVDGFCKVMKELMKIEIKKARECVNAKNDEPVSETGEQFL